MVEPLPTKEGIYIVDDHLTADTYIYRNYGDMWVDFDGKTVDMRELPMKKFRRLVIDPADVKTKEDYRLELIAYLAEFGLDSSKITIDYDFKHYKHREPDGRELWEDWPADIDVAKVYHLQHGSYGHFEGLD